MSHHYSGPDVSFPHGDARLEARDHRFFAGWRSDPFFFDVTGALKDFHRQRLL
jgi:hypothetical protein